MPRRTEDGPRATTSDDRDPQSRRAGLTHAASLTPRDPRRSHYRADMSWEPAAATLAPWDAAWDSANRAFYETHVAENEFSTSIEYGHEVARALGAIIEDNYRASTREFWVIDLGSGSGGLLEQLRTLLPSDINLMGIDLRRRPDELSPSIEWRWKFLHDDEADITGFDGSVDGVVIAHEFLDDIPCPVVELDDDLEPRLVLVDPSTGGEELGARLTDPAAARMIDAQSTSDLRAWLRAWWPATRPGARREVGLTRDRLWSRARKIVRSGCVIAIDYAHDRTDRAAGVWDAGTLKGFAAGRPMRPIPDGSVNITAHVALDALSGPTGRVHAQSEILGGTTMASWPVGLGSYSWLIDPISHPEG